MAARIYPVRPVRDRSELRLAEDYFALASHYYPEAAAAGNAMVLGVVQGTSPRLSLKFRVLVIKTRNARPSCRA